MKTREVFLGIVLGLIPVVAFGVCLFVGWQLVKACHSHLALFSQVFLGAFFLLLVFGIYKRTGWVFGSKLSGIFTLLVVLSGVSVGLGRWDRLAMQSGACVMGCVWRVLVLTIVDASKISVLSVWAVLLDFPTKMF